MKTWKFTIKPDSKTGFNAFNFCKDNGYIGNGWSGAYETDTPTNLIEAKASIRKRYNKWPYQLKHLLETVKKDDHLWIHKGGKYYLCVAEDEIRFGSDITDDFINYDLGHVRRVKWLEVPEKFISGAIQRGTIARRMIQTIKLSDKEKKYSSLLHKKLTEDPEWMPVIDHDILKENISKLYVPELFSMMSPDDVEDLVASYLQDKGWFLVKSTCFRSKPFFEFSMLNKQGKTCYIQVKSGKNPDSLPPENYKKHVTANSTIYLFSTNKNAYHGDAVEGVMPITHNEFSEWIINNPWALTLSLKTRLSMFC